ncbi:response regulator transcription factor [Nannocystis bainbridge]|uniref:Response regulator transcription factor n=1 Tax=Nannocystis bainbridge TaxID=2995303 RepID=A0ABT5DY52_9BACT|nr:response regulator transcription factor [Nannocystis bainbridge]MDC0718523.1 response regulator transcription factor [Nannocystis bainbridge]
MTTSPRLLLVEDEQHLAAGLKLNFELEGYAVDLASTARRAAELLLGARYDVIVLDVMLPDTDGFELCKKLRDGGNFSPVLMLTARDATDDRVRGLEVGADDYLVKPFELSELLARVRSLLRRRSWEREQRVPQEQPLQDASIIIVAPIRFGDAVIDVERGEARMGDLEVKLTRLEFDLVRYFASNPGRVLSRQELQEQVWKLANYPNTRMVDNFIMRLRRHFEPDPVNPVYFVSVRGTGYKFVVPTAVTKP